jgi:pSer/pThr/pTyr-binding forkhead associated (FHA) protein
MARLILMFKDNVLDIYPLSSDRGVTIGRHHSNGIVIDNLAVSGYHARVDVQDGAVSLVDLQSKNGTFVNNSPVIDSPLHHKDTIVIGKHALVLDLHDDIDVDTSIRKNGVPSDMPSAISEEKTMSLDTSQGRQMRGEEEPPRLPEPIYAEYDNLFFLSGDQGELSLSRQQVTIGSNKDADITVGGLWGLITGNPAATINKQAGDYFLRYSGGLLKPKCNGAGVKGTIKLNHDDILELGSVKVRVQLRKRATVD